MPQTINPLIKDTDVPKTGSLVNTLLMKLFFFFTTESMKNKIAAHTLTPKKMLNYLAVWGEKKTRLEIITNPNSSPQMLSYIIENSDDSFFTSLADNIKTPPHVLTTIAKKSGWSVHYKIANNPNAPTEALETIINKNWRMATFAVVSRPNLPQFLVEKILETTTDEMAYYHAVEVLIKFPQYSNWTSDWVEASFPHKYFVDEGHPGFWL